MRKSYFILKTVKPHSREKTDMFWSQDIERFMCFLDWNMDAIKAQANKLRFFWRNKEIAFNKLLNRYRRHAEREWGKSCDTVSV